MRDFKINTCSSFPLKIMFVILYCQDMLLTKNCINLLRLEMFGCLRGDASKGNSVQLDDIG